jgi:hypothetical protein
LVKIISGIDQADASSRYEVEKHDNKGQSPTSSTSSVEVPEKKIIHWENGDPENPHNWSFVRLELSFISMANILSVEED